MRFSIHGVHWIWLGAGALVMALALGLRDGRNRDTAVFEAWETDPAAWGRIHPREYHSWRMGRETATRRGMEGDPTRSVLFAGYGLAEAEAPSARRHPVSCSVCHDPRTMNLRVTEPSFAHVPSRRDMGTYVCVQCHHAGASEFVGSSPAESFLAAAGQSTDWIHGLSGAPMLKIRHPEFEMWASGVHASSGVACSDCHMPRRLEGSTLVTDHALKSPLSDVEGACRPCHHRREEALLARVEAIQAATLRQQKRVAEALVAAHRAVGAAKGSDQELRAMRDLLRQAQARWELVASDHSKGFHAPQEALRLLGTALDDARKAEILARGSE